MALRSLQTTHQSEIVELEVEVEVEDVAEVEDVVKVEVEVEELGVVQLDIKQTMTCSGQMYQQMCQWSHSQKK